MLPVNLLPAPAGAEIRRSAIAECCPLGTAGRLMQCWLPAVADGATKALHTMITYALSLHTLLIAAASYGIDDFISYAESSYSCGIELEWAVLDSIAARVTA